MIRSGRPALVPIAGASLAALALTVLVAACGGGGAPSAGAATPVPSGVVAVEARDNPYAFSPSTVTVPAGTVTFSVKNAGNEEHRFEIFKGETVVGEVEGLVSGLTKDLTVTLEAGEYTFACLLNGHDQLGMKGALTVTGG